MKKSIAIFVLASSVLFSARASGQSAPKDGGKRVEGEPIAAIDQPDLSLAHSEMRAMIERYIEDRGSLNRLYSISLSPRRTARLAQFYSGWLAALAKLDFDSMSQDGQIDYLLFRNHLEHLLRRLDTQAKQAAEMEPLIPFLATIVELEEARRRMEPISPERTAAVLADLSQRVEALRKAVEAGTKPAKKSVADRAVVAISGLKNVLKNWFGFYNGYDPQFTWWVTEPYKQVDQMLQEYAGFVREKLVGVKIDDKETIIGDPVGREALLDELAYAMIPYTPEELVDIANKEFAWCEAEMVRASRELGYGDDWQKALEYVKTLHVEPGKQPELIRSLALEAIAFLEKHDLVTIPPLARETWRMEMMSPERQLVNPFFTGGEVISVSFPTSTMTQQQKLMSLRGNNIHFSRATVFHELVPGHHLQGFLNARHRAYRGHLGTPFSIEGWALYWELLLWDMNFAKSPENRIGMLFWRMHRCARVIFSLSFHLERMSPQQCIEFLVQRVGHELDNATAEVRRSFSGADPPLYQCAYLLGGLQFRALHKELVQSGKMTPRAFHDTILKENRIPVELVRASLTRQKLDREFSSHWKFYE